MKNEVMDEVQFNAAMDGDPTIEELEGAPRREAPPQRR